MLLPPGPLKTRVDEILDLPPGDISDQWAEERFLKARGLPVSSFDSEAVPTGVSYRDHLGGLTLAIMSVYNEICAFQVHKPRYAIADIDFWVRLEALLWDRVDNWDVPSVKIYGALEVRREIDLREPYFIPRGEMHILYAWHYNRAAWDVEQWPRPVGVVRLTDCVEPPLVTLARAAL